MGVNITFFLRPKHNMVLLNPNYYLCHTEQKLIYHQKHHQVHLCEKGLEQEQPKLGFCCFGV